jgi:hypothetical protein
MGPEPDILSSPMKFYLWTLRMNTGRMKSVVWSCFIANYLLGVVLFGSGFGAEFWLVQNFGTKATARQGSYMLQNGESYKVAAEWNDASGKDREAWVAMSPTFRDSRVVDAKGNAPIPIRYAECCAWAPVTVVGDVWDPSSETMSRFRREAPWMVVMLVALVGIYKFRRY